MAELETLEIVIEHKSSTAASAVNDLSTALRGLKQAMSKAGIEALAERFKELNAAINGLKPASVQRIERAANALAGLKNVNLDKVFGGQNSRMDKKIKAVETIGDTVKDTVKAVKGVKAPKGILDPILGGGKEGIVSAFSKGKSTAKAIEKAVQDNYGGLKIDALLDMAFNKRIGVLGSDATKRRAAMENALVSANTSRLRFARNQNRGWEDNLTKRYKQYSIQTQKTPAAAFDWVKAERNRNTIEGLLQLYADNKLYQDTSVFGSRAKARRAIREQASINAELDRSKYAMSLWRGDGFRQFNPRLSKLRDTETFDWAKAEKGLVPPAVIDKRFGMSREQMIAKIAASEVAAEKADHRTVAEQLGIDVAPVKETIDEAFGASTGPDTLKDKIAAVEREIDSLNKKIAQTEKDILEPFHFKNFSEIERGFGPGYAQTLLEGSGIAADKQKLEELKASLPQLRAELEGTAVSAEKVSSAGAGVATLSEAVKEAQAASNTKDWFKGISPEAIKSQIKDVTRELVAAQKELLDARSGGLFSGDNIAGISSAVGGASADAASDKVATLSAQLKILQDALAKVDPAARNASRGISSIGKSSKHSTGRLGGLVKQFMRVAKMRALRAAVMAIADGFRTGVSNLYQWSKALNGSFAASMDAASTSMMYMKNSVATAVAPAIQALIPVLQTVVNWVVTAMNAVAQFLALLNGAATWTRAKTAVQEYGAAAQKSLGGAGSAAKNVLADFDELNVLSQGGGGGGGGGGAAGLGYEDMFEEVGVFDEKIRNLFNFCRDNIDYIKGAVIGIGTIIAAWKIWNKIQDMNAVLAGLLGLGAVALTFYFSYTFTDAYMESGDPKELIKNALSTALGVTVAAAAGKRLFGTKGAEYTAGITLAISAAADITAIYGGVVAQGFDEKTLYAGALAAIKSATGGAIIGYALGGIKGALIGGVAGLLIGVSTTVYAVIDAARVHADREKLHFGNLELTQEEVKSWAESYLNVNVEATANIIRTQLEMSEQAKAQMNTDFAAMMGNWNVVVSLGIDASREQIDSLVASIGQFVTSAQNSFDQTLQTISVGVTFLPALNGDGENISDDFLSTMFTGNELLSGAVEHLGTLLSGYITEGYAQGLSLSENQMALDTLQTLANVTGAVELGRAQTEFTVGTKRSLSNLTEESVNSVMGELTGQVEEYRNALYELETEFISGQVSYRDGLQAYVDLLEGQGLEVPQEYYDEITRLNQLIEEFDPVESVNQKLRETLGETAPELARDLQEVYSDALGGKTIKRISELFGNIFSEDNLFGVDSDVVSDNVRSLLTDGINMALMNDLGLDQTTLEAMELFGITGWDLLDKEMQTQVAEAIFSAVGDDFIMDVAAVFEELGYEIPPSIIAGIYRNASSTQNKLEKYVAGLGSKTKSQIKNVFSGLEFEIGVGVKVKMSKDQFQQELANMGVSGKVTTSKGTYDISFTTLKPGGNNSTSNLAYAGGGFPASGNIFFANENGSAELVGRVGSRTGVANDQQIADVISQQMDRNGGGNNSSGADVAAAVASALKNVVMYVDGQAFGHLAVKKINEYQSATGRVELRI